MRSVQCEAPRRGPRGRGGWRRRARCPRPARTRSSGCRRAGGRGPASRAGRARVRRRRRGGSGEAVAVVGDVEHDLVVQEAEGQRCRRAPECSRTLASAPWAMRSSADCDPVRQRGRASRRGGSGPSSVRPASRRPGCAAPSASPPPRRGRPGRGRGRSGGPRRGCARRCRRRYGRARGRCPGRCPRCGRRPGAASAGWTGPGRGCRGSPWTAAGVRRGCPRGARWRPVRGGCGSGRRSARAGAPAWRRMWTKTAVARAATAGGARIRFGSSRPAMRTWRTPRGR